MPLVVCPAKREASLGAWTTCRTSLLKGGWRAADIRRVRGVSRDSPPPGFVESDLKPCRILSMCMAKSWLRRARLVAKSTGVRFIAWAEDDCQLLKSFCMKDLVKEATAAGSKPLWAGWYPIHGSAPRYGSTLVRF